MQHHSGLLAPVPGGIGSINTRGKMRMGQGPGKDLVFLCAGGDFGGFTASVRGISGQPEL